MSRIPPRRKPRRVRSELFFGHKRVVLHGEARSKRRAEIFERAGGRCEEVTSISFIPVLITKRCPNRATEWSHTRHGANKCDCLDPRCSIASCAECHKRRHAGGKPVPVKERTA